MQVFDEESFTIAVVYPGQTVTVTVNQDDLTYGCYVYLFMRTQPRSSDNTGMQELNQREDLIKRGPKKTIIYKDFVAKGDPINTPQYQLVNINGWAGLPATEAFYWVVAPGDDQAAKKQCSSTTIQHLPVDYDKNGYWSLTAYNPSGWVKTDQFRIDSHSAKANEDGSYTIHFHCEDADNNLQTTENWNALMRAYLPNSLDAIQTFSNGMTKDHPVVTQQ